MTDDVRSSDDPRATTQPPDSWQTQNKGPSRVDGNYTQFFSPIFVLLLRCATKMCGVCRGSPAAQDTHPDQVWSGFAILSSDVSTLAMPRLCDIPVGQLRVMRCG